MRSLLALLLLLLLALATAPSAGAQQATPDPAGSGFHTPPEHWLLTLQRAGHLSFADTCRPGSLIGISCDQAMPQDQAHTLVDRWATAFLLQWVAGDARYAPVLDALRASGDPALQVAVSGR